MPSRKQSPRRILAELVPMLEALTARAGDPKGDRCGVSQEAKDEVRSYVDSWITPWIREALDKLTPKCGTCLGKGYIEDEECDDKPGHNPICDTCDGTGKRR